MNNVVTLHSTVSVAQRARLLCGDNHRELFDALGKPCAQHYEAANRAGRELIEAEDSLRRVNDPVLVREQETVRLSTHACDHGPLREWGCQDCRAEIAASVEEALAESREAVAVSVGVIHGRRRKPGRASASLLSLIPSWIPGQRGVNR